MSHLSDDFYGVEECHISQDFKLNGILLFMLIIIAYYYKRKMLWNQWNLLCNR